MTVQTEKDWYEALDATFLTSDLIDTIDFRTEGGGFSFATYRTGDGRSNKRTASSIEEGLAGIMSAILGRDITPAQPSVLSVTMVTHPGLQARLGRSSAFLTRDVLAAARQFGEQNPQLQPRADGRWTGGNYGISLIRDPERRIDVIADKPASAYFGLSGIRASMVDEETSFITLSGFKPKHIAGRLFYAREPKPESPIYDRGFMEST